MHSTFPSYSQTLTSLTSKAHFTLSSISSPFSPIPSSFHHSTKAMRAGGCTVQQSLTPEAAAVVKQALTLARRRGHAQVTPLHVASTMLSSSTGLLRTACLQSHSHPLQCKALELCFNVALNRLPASTFSPMLPSIHSHQFPSISNALVAAFKRAQAHQRRGSTESQQQPLLAVKIELEQLIISILDDPSVSRVMKEAGFSSTQVKSNVEQVVSLEICSNSSSNSVSAKLCEPDMIRDEDINSVLDSLLMSRKKPGVAIVGECLESIEGVIKGVMEKVSKGDVVESLREVKFIQFPFSSFGQLSRVEVDQKIEELKRAVGSYLSKGVVLNLGDLKWVIELREKGLLNGNYLSPIEHMITQLGKLACGISDNNGKLWLMGIATFPTYMKCKSGHPSLEAIWGLQPITIPAESLRLSLITDSETVQRQSTSNKVNQNGSLCWIEEEKLLNCCVGCTAKFQIEARTLQTTVSKTSTLPAWLRQCKNDDELGLNTTTNDQARVSIRDLCTKWNSFCDLNHRQIGKTITFSSTSCFSNDQQYPNLPRSLNNSFRGHDFLNIGDQEISNDKGLMRMYIPDQNPALPFSSPNSTSSSDVMETEYLSQIQRYECRKLLKIISEALEKIVPWQKDVIPDLASTILQCRSGMVKRKGQSWNFNDCKEETWLLLEGVDVEAKEKVAKELAKVIFGSENSFFSIALSSFSSTTTDSNEDSRNKRSRDEHSCSYIDRFADALSSDSHRVFFVEDVDQADYCSQVGFKRAVERGKVVNSNGEEVGLKDAIVILSCERFSAKSRACTPSIKNKHEEKVEEGEEEKVTSPCVILDLNISIDNDPVEDDQSIDDIGLLESVDKRIIFKSQEL